MSAWSGSALEQDMAAYLIVEHTITDHGRFEEYRTKGGPMMANYGGRYLTKGGSHRVLETAHALQIESSSSSSPT